MAAMAYAVAETGRNVSAADLSYNTIRSKQYTCLYCNTAVSYVNESAKAKAHFRHRPGQSCISISNKQKTVLEEQAKRSIQNGMSQWHKQWQAIFPKECTEQRIKDACGKTRVADVVICNASLQLVDEGPFLNCTELVIEFQHSYITVDEALARGWIYATDDRALLWIIDAVNHDLEVQHIGKYTQLVFPRNHPVVNNILQTCCSNVHIMIDTGQSLWLVTCAPDFDNQDFLVVEHLDISKFLLQVGACCKLDLTDFDVSKQPCPTVKDHVEQVMCGVAEKDKGAVSVIFEMMARCSSRQMRRCAYILRKWTKYPVNYIELVLQELSKKSQQSMLMLQQVKHWLQVVRERHYVDEITFGKHRGKRLCDLEEHYLRWMLQPTGYLGDVPSIKVRELLSIYNAKQLFTQSYSTWDLHWGVRQEETVSVSLLGEPDLDHGRPVRLFDNTYVWSNAQPQMCIIRQQIDDKNTRLITPCPDLLSMRTLRSCITGTFAREIALMRAQFNERI